MIVYRLAEHGRWNVSLLYTMTNDDHVSQPTSVDNQKTNEKLHFIRAPFHFADEIEDPAELQYSLWEETDSSFAQPDFLYTHGDCLLGRMMDEYPAQVALYAIFILSFRLCFYVYKFTYT